MPETVEQGTTTTAAIRAVFRNADDPPVLTDPTNHRYDLIDADGVTVLAQKVPTVHEATGIWSDPYTVAFGAPLGVWEVIWWGEIDGVESGPVSDFFTVEAAGSDSPEGTCGLWATEEDLCTPCDAYDAETVALMPAALQAASEILFERSGRRFPGLCQTTVRPCARVAGGDGPTDYGYGLWRRSWGICGCSGGCSCSGRSEVELGAKPIVSIQQVKVDGVVLTADVDYFVSGRKLVRTPDADGHARTWPYRQRLDLPDTEEDTWSVTYTSGREPPAAGVRAAAVLACELAQACIPNSGDKCRIPRNVQAITRQGITIVMAPSDFLTRGHIGIWEVDLFLDTYPSRHRRAAVFSPDVAPTARRP